MFFALTAVAATVVSAEVTPAATRTGRALRAVAFASRSSGAVISGRAVLVAAAEARAIAAGRAAAALTIIKFAAGALVAGVFGVTIGGLLFLCPRGEEKFFQIKVCFWSCTHAVATGRHPFRPEKLVKVAWSDLPRIASVGWRAISGVKAALEPI